MWTLKAWLEKTILPLNLCPFARGPYEKGLVRICKASASTPKAAQDIFLDELELINEAAPTELSTTLIGFDQWRISFEDFLDFAGAMEEILEEAGLSDQLQLVVFHPEFRLEGYSEKSFAHWPNSSPYPILHLLRTPEVMAAASSELGVEISLANEKTIARLSETERREHFPWKFRD